ncbi:MAG: leucyl aminopeptidase, partial [Dehalococcoidia bacterium]|nr:leucyl aminopeptidase [Dehalococcoidia bacterium]
MDIKIAYGKLALQKADALVIGIYENEPNFSAQLTELDVTLGGVITRAIKEGRLNGKLSEYEIFHTPKDIPAGLLAVLGLGKRNGLTPDKLRGAFGDICKVMRQNKAAVIAAEITDNAISLSVSDTAQAAAEGAYLGLYTFRRHITKKAERPDVKSITLLFAPPDVEAAKAGADIGRTMAEAAILARDMANEPSNFMYPADIAAIAQDIAQTHKMEITVLDKDEMAELGMNATLSVAQGSAQPPKFIIMAYKGRASDSTDLALVGKGLTFDSGGISLKPSDGMGDMKGDMAGAASVIAAMSAIAGLKPKLNVSAVVAAIENMPGSTAYKPGDVVRAMNGKTIEIISTDAEGRLTLADAISYVNAKLKARYIVDVATLTGACIIALGHAASAVLTNNQELADKVLAAGRKTGELSWQMPMFEEYREQNKSDVADIKNAGGRPAGTITAGMFVGEFAENTPWVHMDIAGVDQSKREHGYI